AGLPRRPDDGSCPADPFYTRVSGHDCYATPGLREAVRAAILAPPGGTVIGNLPTGSGKSSIVYTVAAMAASARERSVAIVVVPTTALALDQDRAFRDFAASGESLRVPDVLTYHAGLSPDARGRIRQRIRAGEQTILFTSPESL